MIKQLQAHESDPDGAVPPAHTKDERDSFAALIDSINQVTEMASEPAPAADGRRTTATGAINPELTALSDDIDPDGLAVGIREGPVPPRACGASWKDVPKALRAWTSSPPISRRSSSAASSTTSGPSPPATTSSPPSWRKGGGRWHTWLILGGRGSGKTRAGAEWVRAQVIGEPPLADRRSRRIALVGDTIAQVRSIMIEGVSGLMSIYPPDKRPKLEVSKNQLVWNNGTMAQLFGADDPDSLRGPQFDAAWCDELAKWRRPDLAWDNLQFALRLGRWPQCVITTTPRPLLLLKKILDDAATRRHPLAHGRQRDGSCRPRSWPRCSAATATPPSAARSWKARSSRSA